MEYDLRTVKSYNGNNTTLKQLRGLGVHDNPQLLMQVRCIYKCAYINVPSCHVI